MNSPEAIRFALVPLPVLEQSLRAFEISVYVSLASFSNKNGDCHPGVEAIAKRAGLGATSTRQLLEVLATKGLVIIERGKRNGNRQAPNSYRLPDVAAYWGQFEAPCPEPSSHEASGLDTLKSYSGESSPNNTVPGKIVGLSPDGMARLAELEAEIQAEGDRVQEEMRKNPPTAAQIQEMVATLERHEALKRLAKETRDIAGKPTLVNEMVATEMTKELFPEPQDAPVAEALQARGSMQFQFAEPPSFTKQGQKQRKAKKTVISAEEKSLYHDIQESFESISGPFTDYRREGPAIKRMMAFALKEAPDSPREYVHRMIDAFEHLSKSQDRYWSAQPFIPSVLASGGIWPRVKKELDKEGLAKGCTEPTWRCPECKIDFIAHSPICPVCKRDVSVMEPAYATAN